MVLLAQVRIPVTIDKNIVARVEARVRRRPALSLGGSPGVFTGRLDAGATTGLGGHAWKFRRRSNPQLGGRRGYLGDVGAREARPEVRGKR